MCKLYKSILTAVCMLFTLTASAQTTAADFTGRYVLEGQAIANTTKFVYSPINDIIVEYVAEDNAIYMTGFLGNAINGGTGDSLPIVGVFNADNNTITFTQDSQAGYSLAYGPFNDIYTYFDEFTMSVSKNEEGLLVLTCSDELSLNSSIDGGESWETGSIKNFKFIQQKDYVFGEKELVGEYTFTCSLIHPNTNEILQDVTTEFQIEKLTVPVKDAVTGMDCNYVIKGLLGLTDSKGELREFPFINFDTDAYIPFVQDQVDSYQFLFCSYTMSLPCMVFGKNNTLVFNNGIIVQEVKGEDIQQLFITNGVAQKKDVESGINDGVQVVKTPEDNRIFNLNGQLVGKDNLLGMPKGVYIKNGKKFIVK